MGEEFPDSEITRALLFAEQQIRLIDRVAPLNLVAERERLLAALGRGEPLELRFRYGNAPDLSRLRSDLTRLAEHLAGGDDLAALYGARAAELEREAATVEAVGRTDFRRLARLRFAVEPEADVEAVDELVRSWLRLEPAEPSGELVDSADATHPRSLLSLLRARIGASGLGIRVELRPSLPTVAAAGRDIVLVRPGVRLSLARAQRIARHELEGHVFPRMAAARETLGIFRAGASRSAEHEEGRALLIEERAGLLNDERRRELALRHVAACAVRDGASLVDVVSDLARRGAAGASALEIALRAFRGGGLAREVVYLPAYLRVKAAFAEAPALEGFFERGRVAVAAAQTLDAYEQGLRPVVAGGVAERRFVRAVTGH